MIRGQPSQQQQQQQGGERRRGGMGMATSHSSSNVVIHMRFLERMLVFFLLVSLLLVTLSYRFLYHFTNTLAAAAAGDVGTTPKRRRDHDMVPLRLLLQQQKQKEPTTTSKIKQKSLDHETKKKNDRPNVDNNNNNNNINANPITNYDSWRALAVKLAQLPARQVLHILETQDPFQVRTFEQQLVREETKQGRILTRTEIQQLFPCPSSSSNTNQNNPYSQQQNQQQQRITIPNQRNITRITEFHNGHGFLFFQHLRKAGGTHFCTLAQKNLPRRHVPKYYCMPDMHWPEKTPPGAGYLHSWTNAQIMQHYQAEQFRIAGNEWDTFDVQHHFALPAVFTTSFRNPLDRALSQFRFECLEHRGCKIFNVTEWWQKRSDLANVYVRTFADPHPPGRLRQLYRDETNDSKAAARKRGNLIGTALDTVAQFHLVMVMEWLAYAGPLVTKVLGFHDTSQLTERVRPHIGQAPRKEDGRDHNVWGARGVLVQPQDFFQGSVQDSKDKDKNTNTNYGDHPKTIQELQQQIMNQDLALDEILTDAARRMFLERLVCDDDMNE